MNFFEERAARNEALFREVNEQIDALAQRHRGPAAPVGFVCECSNADCIDHVFMTLVEYQGVRRDGRRFVIARGHEHLGIEDVVERHARYVVVQKHGAAGVIAEQTDPR